MSAVWTPTKWIYFCHKPFHFCVYLLLISCCFLKSDIDKYKFISQSSQSKISLFFSYTATKPSKCWYCTTSQCSGVGLVHQFLMLGEGGWGGGQLMWKAWHSVHSTEAKGSQERGELVTAELRTSTSPSTSLATDTRPEHIHRYYLGIHTGFPHDPSFLFYSSL